MSMSDSEIQFYLLSFAYRKLRFRILEENGVDSGDLSTNLSSLLNRGLLTLNGGIYSISSSGRTELLLLSKKLSKKGCAFLMPARSFHRRPKAYPDCVFVPQSRKPNFWLGRG